MDPRLAKPLFALPIIAILVSVATPVSGVDDVRDITLGAQTCSTSGGGPLTCDDNYDLPRDLPFNETPMQGSILVLEWGCMVGLRPTGLSSASATCSATTPSNLSTPRCNDSLLAQRPSSSGAETVTLYGTCSVVYGTANATWGVSVTGSNMQVIDAHYRLYIIPVRDVQFMAAEIDLTTTLDDWLPFLVYAAAAIWGWQGRNLFLAVVGTVGMLSVFVLPLWTQPLIILAGILAIWADYFAHYGKRRDQEIAPGAPQVGGGDR